MHRLVRVLPLLALLLLVPVVVQTQTVRLFTLPFPDSQPWDISLGPDGNMWFTEGAFNANRVGRIDPAGRIREFLTPSRTFTGSITPGPDGAMWFTEPSGFPFSIGRVTTSGVITEFGQDLNTCGPCSLTPYGIVTGPDGNVWFTEWTKNGIVKTDPATGSFTFFSTFGNGFPPAGITVGPDGALWFTINNTHKIGRIDTLGNITEFGPVADPLEIATGPDGNLWFTQPIDNSIGRITTAGAITIFRVPRAGAFPRDIVAGPDGNLWFTEHDVNRVARISTDGVITEVLQVAGGPWSIARGAGATMWITLKDGNQLGQFTVQGTPPPPPPAATAPSLIAPSVDATVAQPVAFDWSDVAGATGYELQVDDASTMSAPFRASPIVAASQASLGNLPAQALWWRVRARNADGSFGPFSDVRRFVAQGSTSTLTAPALSSPANDARFSRGASVAFDWSDVAGAASYTIEVDNSESFSAPLIFTQAPTASQVVVAALPAQRLWWRVRANGTAGNAGPWSATRRFELK
jgi:virginiamycin B lyase